MTCGVAAIALVVSAAVAGTSGVASAQTAPTTTPTRPPALSSQCLDPAADGLAGQAGPSGGTPELDLRATKIEADNKGDWTWTTTTRGDLIAAAPAPGAPPAGGAFELSVYRTNPKRPDVKNLAFVIHADPRNAAQPVQVRTATSTAFKKLKAKWLASGKTLSVTVPAANGPRLPKSFAWSVSAISDDPNTPTPTSLEGTSPTSLGESASPWTAMPRPHSFATGARCPGISP